MNVQDITFTATVSLYGIIINIVAFVVYAYDKFAAIHQRQRIPNATLLLVAFLGGATGAYIGMYILRHKTKTRTFTLTIPLLCLTQIIGVLYYWYR